MGHRKIALVAVAVLSAFLGADLLLADEGGGPDSSKLPLCPLMGEPINFNMYAQTQEGRVYFCCKDCIKKFEENPQKYAKKVEQQREALSPLPRVQVLCPVMGEPLDGKSSAVVEGKKVEFCCKGCIRKFAREPGKYQARLAESYTYQTKCPVSGESIDPKVSIKTVGGQQVYFCCSMCAKKFGDNPQPFAGKLAEQGYTAKVEDLAPAKNEG